MIAAISAARNGSHVLICEKNAQLGKKILASGNGRCNLLNDSLSADHYNGPARPLVNSVFGVFGKPQILALFDELGLKTYSQDGRIFPYTNQAASVLTVLQMEIERLHIPTELGFMCSSIRLNWYNAFESPPGTAKRSKHKRLSSLLEERPIQRLARTAAASKSPAPLATGSSSPSPAPCPWW